MTTFILLLALSSPMLGLCILAVNFALTDFKAEELIAVDKVKQVLQLNSQSSVLKAFEKDNDECDNKNVEGKYAACRLFIPNDLKEKSNDAIYDSKEIFNSLMFTVSDADGSDPCTLESKIKQEYEKIVV